jgi:hypothetical protein
LTVVAYHKKIKEISTTRNDKETERFMRRTEKEAEKVLDKLCSKPVKPISHTPDFTDTPEYQAIKPRYTSGGNKNE